MSNESSRQRSGARLEAEWQAFREKADAEWQVEMAEEMRIRREVLPSKPHPFPSPVTHPEIVVEESVPVPMRDGVILRADIYRPRTPGRFPTAVNRSPYDRRSSLDYTPSVARNLAQRGYACVCQDVRGRYESEGDYTPLHEIDDGVDTVEWAASQPWSNGRVGMFGVSYQGFASLSAAIGRAPHLRCIYPAMIEYGVSYRRSGVPQLLGVASWQIWAGQGKELLNPRRIDCTHLPLCEIDEKAGHPNPQFDAIVTLDMQTALHGEMSDEMIEEHLSRICAKVYMVAGWYDELCVGTIETWRRIAKVSPDAKLMIGPWHHNLMDMEQPRIGRLPTNDIESKRYYEELEGFLASHLKGEGSAYRHTDAPVKIFVMGRNVWRDEYEWPLARTERVPLYLHSKGNAGSDLEDGLLERNAPSCAQPPDEFDYDPMNPVSWSLGTDVFSYLNEMGDRNEVENRPDVLVYSTPPLEEELEVTGEVTITLYAASDCEDTDFVATLIDVHPNGHTQYLTHGIIRARYRLGSDRPRLIEPGHVYEYEIDMWPTSNAFQKGHRIRVEISSSDFARYARNQNVAAPPGRSDETRIAHQSIFHGGDHPSRIVLPIIRGDSGGAVDDLR